MSAPLPFLGARDPLWAASAAGICDNVVEVSTVTSDDDLNGIGGHPAVGDLGSTGIRVPLAPTTSPSTRYLARLCGIEIPSGYAIIVQGLRQAATIRTQTTENGIPLVLEREIDSPLWRFLDGNISWHLRHEENLYSRHVSDPAQTPGTDPTMLGLAPALLYVPPLVPYVPPNGGLPPGGAINGLGSWRDIRFPWTSTDWGMSEIVRGPGRVVMYASVRQTNPSALVRPLYPDVEGMRPEDRFVSNFQLTAVYGRVAGSIIFNIMPCCADDDRVLTPDVTTPDPKNARRKPSC